MVEFTHRNNYKEQTMSYRLTLTKNDRKAIDWIGDRYSHGHDLFKLICQADWEVNEELPILEFDWESDLDMTFVLPEILAWELQDLLEDSHFECFSGELVAKLLNFMGAIV